MDSVIGAVCTRDVLDRLRVPPILPAGLRQRISNRPRRLLLGHLLRGVLLAHRGRSNCVVDRRLPDVVRARQQIPESIRSLASTVRQTAVCAGRVFVDANRDRDEYPSQHRGNRGRGIFSALSGDRVFNDCCGVARSQRQFGDSPFVGDALFPDALLSAATQADAGGCHHAGLRFAGYVSV